MRTIRKKVRKYSNLYHKSLIAYPVVCPGASWHILTAVEPSVGRQDLRRPFNMRPNCRKSWRLPLRRAVFFDFCYREVHWV